MASAEYDSAADALYIRLREADVARSVEVDDYRVVDLDAEGEVLGLEVLYPERNLVIAPIARQYGFADQLAEIDRAVAEVVGSLVEPEFTVAITYMVSPTRYVFPLEAGVPRSTSASSIVLMGDRVPVSN